MSIINLENINSNITPQVILQLQSLCLDHDYVVLKSYYEIESIFINCISVLEASKYDNGVFMLFMALRKIYGLYLKVGKFPL